MTLDDFLAHKRFSKGETLIKSCDCLPLRDVVSLTNNLPQELLAGLTQIADLNTTAGSKVG
ncbi:MAG TPA: hypothetical protein V6D48_24280, partial [Oculatellaceae cyanobacterium]